MAAKRQTKNIKPVTPFVVGPAVKRKRAAAALRATLRRREAETAKLLRIAERVNYGVSLDDTLAFAWKELRGVIPFNRIGFALIDERRGVAVARWAKSDRAMKLGRGYEGRLEGSTLAQVLATGRPRIINDLKTYLAEKPSSDSTRLLVAEGMRASLTCPLVVQGRPVGFMFFTSARAGAYSDAHVAFFRQIAGLMSAVVERGRLYTELADKTALIERQNSLMTRDLDMAQQVQRALIPRHATGGRGVEIAFDYEPATQIGGDILDVIPVDDRHVLLFLGDAVGHGVPAALVMSAVKAALHAAAGRDPRPAAVLESVNESLASILSFHFVTAACALVNRETRDAEVALAGHAPPVLFRAADGSVSQDGDGDLPLGVKKGTTYKAQSVRLEPGDILVFTTDGVTESMDPEDDQYGTERLKDCILVSGCENAAGLLDAVLHDVRAHAAGREPNDDLTLLVVRATE